MATELTLPEVGENIESATVVNVMVKPGDKVTEEQPVVEIETDKATLEVPSNASGQVEDVKVKQGDEVMIGQVLLTIATDGAEAPAKEAEPKEEAASETPASEAGTVRERPEATREASKEEAEAKAEEHVDKEMEQKKAEELTPPPRTEVAMAKAQPPMQHEGEVVPASPSVRRIARELNVDLHNVKGTGPGGRITMDDVRAFAQQRGGESAQAVTTRSLPNFYQYGEIEREGMSNIRQVVADRMAYSWRTVPHVHHWDEADITELFNMMRQRNKRGDGPKLTVTSILMKVSVGLLKKYAHFNSSIDMESKQLIFKQYYNIGVAVDTPRGLLVPVVRDVDQMSILELADVLDQLAHKTREGKIALEDLQGGSFTITNLGGIGGQLFTPIVNWPEVAILGICRATQKFLPGKDGQPELRWVLPLCLGYDHRVIDGADAARYMRDLVQGLSNPLELLLEI